MTSDSLHTRGLEHGYSADDSRSEVASRGRSGVHVTSWSGRVTSRQRTLRPWARPLLHPFTYAEWNAPTGGRDPALLVSLHTTVRGTDHLDR